jgi:hypothetical protein
MSFSTQFFRKTISQHGEASGSHSDFASTGIDHILHGVGQLCRQGHGHSQRRLGRGQAWHQKLAMYHDTSRTCLIKTQLGSGITAGKKRHSAQGIKRKFHVSLEKYPSGTSHCVDDGVAAYSVRFVLCLNFPQ